MAPASRLSLDCCECEAELESFTEELATKPAAETIIAIFYFRQNRKCRENNQMMFKVLRSFVECANSYSGEDRM